MDSQIREEVSFTKGRIIINGNIHSRGRKKRADYVLYYKPNIPIAVIEAKDNNHSMESGIQQALDYSVSLSVPFVFSSNGDGFLFHDKTSLENNLEKNLDLNSFPSPDELWKKYCEWKLFQNKSDTDLIETSYHTDGSGKTPRYYQVNAINKTIEAIAAKQKRN